MCDWSKVPYKCGVPSIPVGVTPYAPDWSKRYAEGYWRDLATARKLKERFEAFETIHSGVPDPDCLKIAQSRVEEMVLGPRNKIKPLRFTEFWNRIPHGSSSGLPNRVKKGQDREYAFRTYARNIHKLRKGKEVKVYPCLNVSRQVVRPKEEGNKPRLAWCYPIEMICLEARFAVPAIESLKDDPLFGTSFNWLNYGQGFHLWLRRFQVIDGIVDVDYSGYDSTVRAAYIRWAFRLVENMFVLDDGDRKVLKHICNYFIHTPLAMSDGMHQKHRGVPSGSYFTQLIDTLVNLMAVEYGRSRLELGNRIQNYSALGDDVTIGIIFDRIDPQKFCPIWTSVMSELGLVVHPEKTKLTPVSLERVRAGKFLGQDLKSEYPYITVDVYSVLRKYLLPERKDKSASHAKTRLVGLCWAYGHDRKTWTTLKLLFDYVSDIEKREGVSKVNDFSHLRWLTHVLNYQPDTDVFPSYTEIRRRYFGYV